MENNLEQKDKYACGFCKKEFDLKDIVIIMKERQCPHCGNKIQKIGLRCMGECKGNTIIVETGIKNHIYQTVKVTKTTKCPICESNEIYEVEKPTIFFILPN